MICPFCKEEILDGAIKCKHCGSMLQGYVENKPKMVICPFCKEEIIEGSIKCRHCGSQLAGNQKASPMVQKETGEMLGYLMLIIPVIAILLIWFWVGQMNILQSPGSTLSFLGIATIVGTAIIAAVEANQLGFGEKAAKSGKMSETGPIGYFLGMILLWIIVYPLYLFQRSKKGKHNLVVSGIIIAAAYAISWYLMYSAISEKAAEIQNIFK